ncbi:hypothetical protein [Vibrio phage LP.1]|nr:hypothetical protein [Vibrio phage LP.1]
MSETKFTKGEWEIKPHEDDKEYIRIRGTVLGGKFKVANVIDLKEHHDNSEWCKRERAESLANAHLIAAAPEIYAALDEFDAYASTDVDYIGSPFQKQVRAALAKARGEQ